MIKQIDLIESIPLDETGTGIVYPYGDYVIKIHKYLTNFQEEYKTQLNLFQACVKVPKPYGFVDTLSSEGNTKGLMMDRIFGENLWNIKGELKDKLTKKMEEEIKKAENLGFYLHDREINNAMVDFKENVFLIDFDKCKSPKRNNFY